MPFKPIPCGIYVSQTVVNQNILEIKNEVRNQFFNLLIINGSLLQLTSQPILKEIFLKTWLSAQGISGGLSFLMGRMKTLQRKSDFLFDPEDPLISTISKIIHGDTEAVGSLVDESYNSDDSFLKKQELAISLAEKSGKINRAQGIYDKVSIVHDSKYGLESNFRDSETERIKNTKEEEESDSDNESSISHAGTEKVDIFQLLANADDDEERSSIAAAARTAHSSSTTVSRLIIGVAIHNESSISHADVDEERSSIAAAARTSHSSSSIVSYLIIGVAILGVGGGYYYLKIRTKDNKVEDGNAKEMGNPNDDENIGGEKNNDENPTVNSNNYYESQYYDTFADTSHNDIGYNV